MWEQVIAKVGALLGRRPGSGMPFTHIDDLRAACDQLHQAGFPGLGREPMYSGVTGERLDGRVFIGCVYYQRLRHMVQVCVCVCVLPGPRNTSLLPAHTHTHNTHTVLHPSFQDKYHARALVRDRLSVSFVHPLFCVVYMCVICLRRESLPPGPVNQLVRRPTEVGWEVGCFVG